MTPLRRRQREYVLLALRLSGGQGMTSRELAEPVDWSRLTMGQVLSELEKDGHVWRTDYRRNGCFVWWHQ